MRLFLDHDGYAVTARFLRTAGHEVVSAGEAGCAAASDTEILILLGTEEFPSLEGSN